VGPDASGSANPGLSRDFRFHRARRDPRPDRSRSNREGRLLCKNESGSDVARLREARAEVRRPKAMLRRLRARLRSPFDGGRPFRLSAHRRRKICRFYFIRDAPLGASPGSAAARLIHSRVGSFRVWRSEGKENSTGGFYEIPIDDSDGGCTRGHSIGDFTVG
jgi:hypothetical protein